MDGILRVTPEKLTSTASEFQATGSKIQSLTGEMSSIVKGLSGVWEGEAATAFTNKFNELQDDMDRMYAMISEHVNDLNEMAQTYSQAENTNAQEGSALAGDVIS